MVHTWKGGLQQANEMVLARVAGRNAHRDHLQACLTCPGGGAGAGAPANHMFMSPMYRYVNRQGWSAAMVPHLDGLHLV
jgi:hypothetical protein